MTDAERLRLVRILGMLGSDFAGERANAARHAEAIGRRHGLTWEDLLALKSEKEAPQPVREPEPPPQPEPPMRSWDEFVEPPLWRCLRMPKFAPRPKRPMDVGWGPCEWQWPALFICGVAVAVALLMVVAQIPLSYASGERPLTSRPPSLVAH